MDDRTTGQAVLTRRQFVRQGVTVMGAVILTACGTESSSPREEGENRQAAQEDAPAPQEPTPAESVRPVEGATAEATSAPAQGALLEPTPHCDDDETPEQTEGPFYTPDTPRRNSFLEDGEGVPMVLTGRVLSVVCEPLAGAVLDFWHADDAGQYDNAGYRFRGHLFTDEQGNYRLETIMPGLYPGRTRHFHVKVQGPTTSLLTTQLYFPGETANEQDGIFHPALLMDVREGGERLEASFDFVLA